MGRRPECGPHPPQRLPSQIHTTDVGKTTTWESWSPLPSQLSFILVIKLWKKWTTWCPTSPCLHHLNTSHCPSPHPTPPPHLAPTLSTKGAYIIASSPCPTKTAYTNWRKADKTAYFDTLERYLKDSLDIIDTDAAIKFLFKLIKTATYKAVPTGISKPGLKPKPFNETIRKLSTESKETDWLWKSSGCPRDPTPCSTTETS